VHFLNTVDTKTSTVFFSLPETTHWIDRLQFYGVWLRILEPTSREYPRLEAGSSINANDDRLRGTLELEHHSPE
jgi:hypothetical protein